MTELKTTQVDGKKYELTPEEIEIEKLIRKALAMDARIRQQKAELENVKQRLTEIGEGRRDGQTTVNLKGVSGESLITFRESWESTGNPEELRRELGDMFTRFFTRKEEYKTGKDLKQFMEGGSDFGFTDAAKVRELIGQHVAKKTLKPNVKLSPVQ